jgi:hypothetical protein
MGAGQRDRKHVRERIVGRGERAVEREGGKFFARAAIVGEAVRVVAARRRRDAVERVKTQKSVVDCAASKIRLSVYCGRT